MSIYITLSLIITVLSVATIIFIFILLKQKKKIAELKDYESRYSVLQGRIAVIDREKKEFIDVIMHELNTPLAITSGYLSMILELAKNDMKPKILELLQKSYDSTQRMTKITEQLLASSNDINEERPQGIQIEDIMQKVYDLYSPRAQEGETVITIHPPKNIPLPLILSDPLSVKNILSNLVDNAVKFTKNGQIDIHMEDDGRYIKVSISDTGVGIPNEAKPRIFDKFYQVDSSHTREAGGTGIGLYNAKALTEKQGGRMWFDSIEGKGSTFYVDFPKA